MDKVEDIHVLKERLENLRDELNKDVVKNIKHSNNGKYKRLLAISRKLDDVMVSYIKISDK